MTGEIIYNKDYEIDKFTKEELEQILCGEVATFWTNDCVMWPNFRVSAPVLRVEYNKSTGEPVVVVMRKRTGKQSVDFSIPTRMTKLKFRILHD